MSQGYASEDISPASSIVGEIKMFGGSVAPTGYHLCDGTALSRTTYSVLFSVIGTAFGVGDGSTTFNVPDMRGIFPRGAGENDAAVTGIDDAAGNPYDGDTLGTYTEDQVESHRHQHTGFHYPGTDPDNYGEGATINTRHNEVITGGVPITDGTNEIRTGAETRPASLSLNFIIKT